MLLQRYNDNRKFQFILVCVCVIRACKQACVWTYACTSAYDTVRWQSWVLVPTFKLDWERPSLCSPLWMAGWPAHKTLGLLCLNLQNLLHGHWDYKHMLPCLVSDGLDLVLHNYITNISPMEPTLQPSSVHLFNFPKVSPCKTVFSCLLHISGIQVTSLE